MDNKARKKTELHSISGKQVLTSIFEKNIIEKYCFYFRVTPVFNSYFLVAVARFILSDINI